uniref:Uncharacterized protein n=1 Tax=Nelumbo nucifera TaxID=4432 RepID=A0A822YCX0_NELNU|nr:TPA_asm: hypothetical protein HUJ06_030607 [Nelumbo nucifera]
MVHKAQRALYALKQAIEEDPDDAVQWHQLGLHNLCTPQFKTSQKYLKATVARGKECSYAWSNLESSGDGIRPKVVESVKSNVEAGNGVQDYTAITESSVEANVVAVDLNEKFPYQYLLQ